MIWVFQKIQFDPFSSSHSESLNLRILKPSVIVISLQMSGMCFKVKFRDCLCFFFLVMAGAYNLLKLEAKLSIVKQMLYYVVSHLEAKLD